MFDWSVIVQSAFYVRGELPLSQFTLQLVTLPTMYWLHPYGALLFCSPLKFEDRK